MKLSQYLELNSLQKEYITFFIFLILSG